MAIQKEKRRWRENRSEPDLRRVPATAASILRIDDLAKWDRALRDHTLFSDGGNAARANSGSAHGRASEIP